MISIVIPAFNRRDIIGPTIESVIAQTLTSWELVVFDDGSTDGTIDVARRYTDLDPRIRVVGGPNGGVASARNRGFATTDDRSRYVIFLDSDDLWEPDALASLAGVLDHHPSYTAVYGLAHCVDAAGALVPGDDLADSMRDRVEFRGTELVPIRPDEPTTFAGLVHRNWMNTPGTFLVRRDVLDRVGGFDPRTDPADDWDLALRVSRQGPIGFLDQVVLSWRRHPETLTETSARWRTAHYRVLRKVLTDPTNTTEQFRVARLSYTTETRGMLRDSWRHLSARRLFPAARAFAKAADRWARLLWLPVLVRSSRRAAPPELAGAAVGNP